MTLWQCMYPLIMPETSLINPLALAKLTWTKCSLRPKSRCQRPPQRGSLNERMKGAFPISCPKPKVCSTNSQPCMRLTPVLGAASKPRGRAANKPRELATSDEESGEQSGEEAPRQDPATQPPRPRPAYRTRRRSAEVDAMSASEDGGEDRSEAEAPASSPAAGKKRSVSARSHQSKSRSVSRSKPPRSRSRASESARSARSSPEGEVTPKASRKRVRAARHEKEGGVRVDGAEDEGVTQGVENILNEERTASSLSPARPASRASSAGAPEEFQVRRKRARH